MDANNLKTAGVDPAAVTASTLSKPRDAAYDQMIKSAFQELTRRKYQILLVIHF
jgi:hypothetical protein